MAAQSNTVRQSVIWTDFEYCPYLMGIQNDDYTHLIQKMTRNTTKLKLLVGIYPLDHFIPTIPPGTDNYTHQCTLLRADGRTDGH